MRRILLASLGLLLIAASCSISDDDDDSTADGDVQVEDAFTPVLVAPLTSSTAPVLGTDGKYHVAYELELQNAKRAPATILKVDVVDAADHSRVLLTLEGDDLLENLVTLGTRPVENAELEPNDGGILAINLAFDSVDDVPTTLLHHIEALAASNPGAREPFEVSYTVAPFSTDGPELLVLGPPLKGSNWIAGNGCCRVGFAHRLSVQSVNGQLINSQRFAIDWIQFDDTGFLFTGEISDPESWHGYGAEVLAMADGTIIHVVNDLDDQVPGANPDLSTLTLQTVEGNSVVIDFGDGLYGFYAHMQKGSVRVEVGDEVKQGDVLGLLGNSGNTSAPHLHFHLMDSPSPLSSNGVPYVINEFEYAGVVDREAFLASETLDDPFGEARLANPEPKEDEFPLQLDIIDFPD